MTSRSPQRIVELWPSLTEKQREALVELAEAAAEPHERLSLTETEAESLIRSNGEFSSDSTLSFEEAEAATDEFLRGLRAKA